MNPVSTRRFGIRTVADSYDNAEAESLTGLHKTEATLRKGPWRGVDGLELATLSWVAWFDETRLHSSIGYVPPEEFEAAFPAASVEQVAV